MLALEASALAGVQVQVLLVALNKGELMNAQINFRDGASYLTEIDSQNTPEALAHRMVRGGFVICEDSRWGKRRILIINLKDVNSIILEDEDEKVKQVV